ncbi:cytochrome P450 [Aquaspirillum sp. LM1]|uniref:cytochrome P450 n=1 Tax=Aquaspirillum sp. LM1 TaxID=1938604 RepID=UPI0035B574D7
MRDECMTALLAGHETTGATLAWWMWELARQPEIQAEVSAEACRILRGRVPTAADAPALTALHRSLEETLRLHPAAPLLSTRCAIRPVTVGPWQLPAGTLLLLPVQLAQHDAQAFAQPDTFCPVRFAERDASTHPHWLPFGLGPRVCLGQHQAMMMLTILAALLAQRFSWRAAANQPAPQPLLQVSCRPDVLWLDIIQRAS